MNNRVFNFRKSSGYLAAIAFLLLFNADMAVAQTTAFTYQGKLSDNGAPASGNYDLTFKLFDTASVGSGVQQGATLNLTNVAVSSGVFTVQLDFGACASCFTGAARFLEISVKPTSGSTFTTLTPRQAVTATPYAIKSLSASSADSLSVTCVSCVTSSQIQSVNGSAVTGTIPVTSVTAGSDNYIQNTTNQQANSNFNVSGNGIVGGNLGIGTTSPQHKLHVVGQAIRVESPDGAIAPRFSLNFTGAGTNQKKWQNYALGTTLAFTALNDAENAESKWLQVNRGGGTTISSVVFPSGNIGIGTLSPQFDLHIVGDQIRFESNSIGAPVFPRFTMSFPQAAVDEKKWQNYVSNDSLIFSAINDAENQESRWLQVIRIGPNINRVIFPNGKIGIGTFSPQSALHIVGQGSDVRVQSAGGATIFPRFLLHYSSAQIDTGKWQNYATGSSLNFTALNDAENNESIWLRVNRLVGTNIINGVEFPISFVRINQLTSGSTSICRDSINQLAFCSSSIRYKKNIQDYQPGLDLVSRLRPVSFNWKADNQKDMGLIAEEVAEVEPLLITYNNKGEIEGVKYDRVGVVLLNAIKEQQAQIARQQTEIEQQQQKFDHQQQEIDRLKKLVAAFHANVKRRKK